MASMNPICSISSASSRTRKLNASSGSVPRFIWSMTRPGVPTITCAPRFRPFELGRVALPTVDGQYVKALHVSRVTLKRLGDLDGEFPCRDEHHCLRLRLSHVDLGQDGKREGARLAGTRLRLSQDVRTGQDDRDRRSLDGGRCLVADVAERLYDVLMEA